MIRLAGCCLFMKRTFKTGAEHISSQRRNKSVQTELQYSHLLIVYMLLLKRSCSCVAKCTFSRKQVCHWAKQLLTVMCCRRCAEIDGGLISTSELKSVITASHTMFKSEKCDMCCSLTRTPVHSTAVKKESAPEDHWKCCVLVGLVNCSAD